MAALGAQLPVWLWLGRAGAGEAIVVDDGVIDYEFTVYINRTEAWSAGIHRTHEFTTDIQRTETLPSPLS